MLDDPVLGDVISATLYLAYDAIAGGLVLPRRYIELLGADTLQDSNITQIVFNSHPADSIFAAPLGAIMPQGTPTPGVATRLADDVYVVPGVYSSLFVVFGDFVLVLEGGENTRATENVIRQVRTIAPNKPIRYVVATHHHYDHIGGLRSYIAEDATIVTTPDAKPVIERMAMTPHRLKPDGLSRNPRPTVIQTVSETRTFEDGKHRVVLYQIGPTPHARQMLIAYLPNEKILFEGDMLDIPDGRPAPGGDDTAQLSRLIDSLRLDVNRIVPVHGVPGTIDDLRAALQHRATVHSYD
ncbi:MAG TPA: MBL fold metallo-hydrolase [Gemmatimonadaceae bacterium]